MARTFARSSSKRFNRGKSRQDRNSSQAWRTILEVLESRTLLSGQTVYVNSATLTAPFDGSSPAQGFTSIGAAITSLNVSPQSGDTIVVETGDTYPENVVIPSTLPGLTIEADTSQTPLVHDSGTGTGITIDASGVTISGLSIAGFATGIDVNSTSASISGNSIGGETTGVQFESAASGSVTGNTFSYTPAPSPTLYNTTDLLLAGGAGSVSTGSNAFLGSTFIDNQSSQYINAVSNTFGGNTPSLANPGDVDYTIQDGIKDAVWYGSSSGLVRIVENNVYVTQANETNSAGAILVRGVAAAANAPAILVIADAGGGETVNIQNGNYIASNVLVPISMTIEGESESGVIMAPAIADSGDNTSFGGTVSNGFVIDASGVKIQTLTIDGSANTPLGADNYRTGIITNYVADSNATFGGIVVNNVTIQNTNRKGVGLYNVNGEATGDVVENSAFSSIGATSTDYEGTYAIAAFQSDIDIENNTITGSAAGIGINSFDGTDFPLVTISGNTISSPSTMLSNGALGLDLASLADKSSISDNSIDLTGGTGSDIGIVLSFAQGSVTASGNSVTGATGGDIGVLLYQDTLSGSPVQLEDNTVSASGSTGGAGILLSDLDSDTSRFGDVPGAVYASLTGNSISGFTTGVSLAGGSDAVVATIGNGTVLGSNYIAHGLPVKNGTTGVLISGTLASATINTDEITTNATNVEFTAGGSGSVDGVNFDLTSVNPIDLLIDTTAGTVTVGLSKPNAFVSTTYIEDRSSQLIDASNNTFGGLTPSAGDLADDYTIESGIVDALKYEGYGLVLIVPGNVYVPQSNETPSLDSSQDAIQRGIDAAEGNSVGTVNVQAGTYVANSAGNPGGLYISQPLTLLGAQAGVDARTRSGDETTILPGAANPDPNSAETELVVYVASSNVTIDGFTVDGDNPNIISGVTLNGVNIDATEGIVSYEGVGNITVQNNIIENTTYTGIDFYNYNNGGAATDNNLITQNLIENLGGGGYGYGVGVLLYNNFYASVTDNTITDVNVGVQTGNFSNADPGDPASTALISTNAISTYGVGVFFNLMYDATSTFTVENNTITAVNDTTDGGSDWTGFLITSIQSDVSVLFNGNTVDGSLATAYTTVEGYEVWNTPTTGAVTIEGGSVGGVMDGVWLNTYETFQGDADATQATIDGVSITASQYGVYVEDSAANTSHPSVFAAIEGDTSIYASGDSATGIEVSGSQASIAFSGTTPAYLDGGLSAYIVLASGAMYDSGPSTLDASQVSFNGVVGASTGTSTADDLAEFYGIEDKITDYLDGGSVGYVSLKSDPVFVAQSSEMASPGAIQRGINVASSGDTVYVQGGAQTYDITAGLNIPQAQLTLMGAMAGVSGTDPSRGTGESTLSGPTSSSIAAFTVANDSDVTIDGFTLDGTGSSSGSKLIGGEPQGVTLGFVDNVLDLNAMAASAQTNMILNNPQMLTLTDNAITTTGSNPSDSAVFQIVGFYAGGADTSNDVDVEGNTFTGIADAYDQSTLQLNLSDVQGTVDSNTFNGVDIGVLVANNAGNLTLESNTFENITRGRPTSPPVPTGQASRSSIRHSPTARSWSRETRSRTPTRVSAPRPTARAVLTRSIVRRSASPATHSPATSMTSSTSSAASWTRAGRISSTKSRSQRQRCRISMPSRTRSSTISTYRATGSCD